MGWCKTSPEAFWNRALSTYKAKQTFTAPSLYDIAKLKVRQVYRNNWCETKCLPQIIQQDLLTDWLKCDEVFPEVSDDEEELLMSRIKNENPFDPERPEPLSTECFVALMMHPLVIPDFVPDEYSHVHFKYFVKTNTITFAKKRLCMRCFQLDSQIYQPHSSNSWKQKNVRYCQHTDHNIVEDISIFIDVIWDTNNWCDNCITEPLFFIVDEDTCRSDYGLHTRKRSRFSNNYDTDDDSDNDYCHVRQMRGNITANEISDLCNL